MHTIGHPRRATASKRRLVALVAATAVLASVFRTYRRQGRDILGAVVELLRHGSGHVLEFDHTTPPVPAV